MKDHENSICISVILQIMNILFSLDSVLIKYASNQWQMKGFLYWKTLVALSASIVFLAIYAIIWQKILHRVSLSVAYVSKGLAVFWGLLFAVVFFDEHITVANVIGTGIIFGGTVLVNKHE